MTYLASVAVSPELRDKIKMAGFQHRRTVKSIVTEAVELYLEVLASEPQAEPESVSQIPGNGVG